MPDSGGLATAVTVHPVYILFLVLEDLTVELVNQPVDGRIHILILSLCVNITASHRSRRLINKSY